MCLISLFLAKHPVHFPLYNLRETGHRAVFGGKNNFVIAFMDSTLSSHAGSDLQFKTGSQCLFYIFGAHYFLNNPINHVSVSVRLWKTGCSQKNTEASLPRLLSNQELQHQIQALFNLLRQTKCHFLSPHSGRTIFYVWLLALECEDLFMQFNRSSFGEPSQNLFTPTRIVSWTLASAKSILNWPLAFQKHSRTSRFYGAFGICCVYTGQLTRPESPKIIL